MLAMVVNDNAGNLTPRDALGCFASMLAPTGIPIRSKKNGTAQGGSVSLQPRVPAAVSEPRPLPGYRRSSRCPG